MANQFRALEEDEIMFLDSVREKQEAEERERKIRDGEELKSFREYVSSCVPFKGLYLVGPQSGRLNGYRQVAPTASGGIKART